MKSGDMFEKCLFRNAGGLLPALMSHAETRKFILSLAFGLCLLQSCVW